MSCGTGRATDVLPQQVGLFLPGETVDDVLDHAKSIIDEPSLSCHCSPTGIGRAVADSDLGTDGLLTFRKD